MPDGRTIRRGLLHPAGVLDGAGVLGALGVLMVWVAVVLGCSSSGGTHDRAQDAPSHVAGSRR